MQPMLAELSRELPRGDFLSAIAPWSLCATRVPLVSTPLRWEEVAEPHKLAFTPPAALERLSAGGDLFAPIAR